MPGFLLHVGATITCAHPPGQAQPTAPNLRVKVSNQPIVVQSTQYAIAGCALTGTPNPPCATAQWTSAATRVRADNIPVLLRDSQSVCAPTGTPLNIMVTQIRVRAI
jgi:hypothetical protein